MSDAASVGETPGAVSPPRPRRRTTATGSLVRGGDAALTTRVSEGVTAPGVLAVVVALLIVGLVGPASAELYRWTDGEGVVHYTADLATIPPAYRDTARAVSHPQARPAPPPTVTPPAPDSPVVPYVSGAPILVVARLNGVPLTLVVDTGADRTVLTPAALARAGFGTEPGRPIEIVGVTGSAAASLVTVPLLDVAGARVGPVAVVVHAIATTTPGGPVDGLLGRDVLDAFTVTVDAGSGRVTLVPR